MSAKRNYSSATVVRKLGYCLLPVLVGAGATLVLLLLAALGGPVPRALASGPVTYPGSTPCDTTLQACIDGSVTGTTIVVQAGTYYTDGLTLNHAVSLTGVSSATVILHAMANQRVLTVTGAAVDSSVIISGLTFAGGHAVGGSCPDGCGGAIIITATAQPLLVNLTISNSRADAQGGGLYADTGGPLVMSGMAVLSSTSAGITFAGCGGGVYAQGPVILNGGVFQNNQCTNFSTGGGLFANGNLTLTGTQFLSNTSFSGGGSYAQGDVTLIDGLFQNNQCNGNCYGAGLGAIGNLTMTGTQFLNNTSTGYIGFGAGAYSQGTMTLNGGLFQNNQCNSFSYCYGGGLFANGNLTMTGTQFLSNASTGGRAGNGGGVSAQGNVTLNGGLFQNNQCIGYCGGAGLYASSDLVLTGTEFLSNSSMSHGGGAIVVGNAALNGGVFQNNQCSSCFGGGLLAGSNLVVTNTQFLSNTSTWSGGGAYAQGNVTLSGGLFQNNQCTGDRNGSGGGLFAYGSLTLTGTQFLGNLGQQGAGLYHNTGDARLVNALFAANQASGQGDALYLASPGSVVILHTTIARPTVGIGAAIVVVSGTVGITDTIIASDTTGINQTAGSVFQDYDLFFGNGTNTSGTVSSGAHNVYGDPKFVNPAAGDYHLNLGSLAVDAGTDAGVTTDLDGKPRPQGLGFDIGAYESPYTALANVGVIKTASTTTQQPGQLLTYTLVYSNSGPFLAGGVRLTDLVPADLISVTYTSTGADLTPNDGQAYVWQVADLPPGSGGVVTVTGVLRGAPRGAVFTNTATITTAYSDTNPANNTSAVGVTVANVPPLAAGDAYTVTGNTTLTVTAPGVLLNDTDANGDPLTAVLAGGPPTGTLHLHADGSFTYTPPHGFVGPVTFTYRANDGLADSNTATVTITVTAAVYELYLPLVLR